ncbi:MAG: hypothetical protein AB7F41_10200 [Methylocystis sp.]|uniref:hypothetical protein n=1 Tax=Methylocystis sp. TaxID=1911079 RepID=UPI003D0D92CE
MRRRTISGFVSFASIASIAIAGPILPTPGSDAPIELASDDSQRCRTDADPWRPQRRCRDGGGDHGDRSGEGGFRGWTGAYGGWNGGYGAQQRGDWDGRN